MQQRREENTCSATRDLAAMRVAGRGFDGYGIGGALEKQYLGTIVGWCCEELPESAPRHLLGISEDEGTAWVVTGDTAEILYVLSFDAGIRVKNVYDDRDGKFHRFKVLPIEASAGTDEKLIVTAEAREEKTNRLKLHGIGADRVIVL